MIGLDATRARRWLEGLVAREGATAAALRASGALPARRSGTWLAGVYAFLAISVTLLPAGGVTFLMAYVLLFVAAYWLCRSREVPRYLPGVMLPFVFIALVGLHGLVRHDLYDAMKDAWYILYPALAFLVGFALMRGFRRVDALIGATLVAAVLVAAIHLSIFAVRPDLLTLPATAIRSLAGTGYYVTCFGVALPLGALAVPGLIAKRHRVLAAVAFLASLASLTLAFSRTLPIIATILLVAVALPVTRRRAVAFAAAVVVIAGVVAAGGLNADSALRYRGGDLLNKWTRLLEEIEVREYHTPALINQNWRGHESARGLATYTAGNPLERIVGRGFGQSIDLGLFINLSVREKSRYIPILHNGYVYLLVKTGLAGLAAYVWVLIYMAVIGVRHARLADPQVAALGRLLVALVLVFAATTVAISGLFNKRELVPLAMFAGCLLGYFSLLGETRSRLAGPAAPAPRRPPRAGGGGLAAAH